MRSLILSLCLIGCGQFQEPRKKEFPETIDQRAERLETRLLDRFLVEGQVVSLRDGQPEGLGDSALWNGVAVGVLPCEAGEPILEAMLDGIVEKDGAYLRYNPLPGEYLGNETSFDAETGLIFGLANRLRNCPEDYDRIREVWSLHRAFTQDGKILFPGAKFGLVPPGFDYSFNLLSHRLGLADSPRGKTALQVVIDGWTFAVTKAKKACYRVHLAQLHLLAVRAMDKQVNAGNFCANVKGVGLPLSDWFCGHEDPQHWLESFKVNEWEYRHQRCSAWENPDGQGMERPGLDYLAMYYLAKE